jgi:hypothetical protein
MLLFLVSGCMGYCLYVFPWLVLVFSSVVACMRGSYIIYGSTAC